MVLASIPTIQNHTELRSSMDNNAQQTVPADAVAGHIEGVGK
jgi:hypothetical protein